MDVDHPEFKGNDLAIERFYLNSVNVAMIPLKYSWESRVSWFISTSKDYELIIQVLICLFTGGATSHCTQPY
jgi:hypothetical protein